jgi:hypothetical protein
MISLDDNISQRDDAEPSIDHRGITFSMLGSAAEKIIIKIVRIN